MRDAVSAEAAVDHASCAHIHYMRIELEAMTTETMELTNFHLGRKQKAALKARAKAKGSNVAEEIRCAVDAYLSGVTSEELEMLDVATRQAESAIAEMSQMLEATNRKADAVFAELERLRGGPPPELVLREAGTSVGARSGAKGKRAAH